MQGIHSNWVRITLLVTVFLACTALQAATHTLNGTDRPALCSGQMGSWSGATYICTWGQPFRVMAGDSVVTTLPQIKILSYSGFDFVGSTIGGNGYVIDLEAQGGNETKLDSSTLYGSIIGSSNNVRLESGAMVNGPVSVTGIFNSSASTITGNVSANNGITATDTTFQGNLTTSSGGINLVGGEVTRDVLVTATSITANGTIFRGALTSTNGAINLTGGSVQGLVKTNCCTIATNGSNLASGAQANSGISIDGGIIAGDLRIVNASGGLVNNDIVITNAVMTSGDVNAFNVQISNSQVGTEQTPVEIIARGNYLNLTNNTTVYGHVEVDNTYGKITIEPGSKVVGTCLADANRNPGVNSNVIGACGGEGGSDVSYYRLIYESPALTCNAVAVEIGAYDSNGVLLAEDSSTLALAPSIWVGGNNASLVAGATTKYLQRRAGVWQLGITNLPDGVGLHCSTSDCRITLQDSGFIFENVSPLIAGKPQNGLIRAVKRDDVTQACVPAFTGPRSVLFSSAYPHGDPVPTRYLSPTLNDIELAPGAAPQSLTLEFDAEASAPLTVVYGEAGRFELSASFTGSGEEEGLVMNGSKPLVSRPYGLCLAADDLTHVEGTMFQGRDKGETVHIAGAPFAIRVNAVAWKDGDPGDPLASVPRTAADICDNPVIQNYVQTGIPLTHKVVEPVGFEVKPGKLGIGSYNHSGQEGGKVEEQSISEVGIFKLIATPPRYLGEDMTHAESESAPIGRFIPARLSVEGIASLDSCDGLSYQGEPVSYEVNPALTVAGKNFQGETTVNYSIDPFWRLNRPEPIWVSREADRDLSSRLEFTDRHAEMEANSDGSRTYRWLRLPDEDDWDLTYVLPESVSSLDEEVPFKLRQQFLPAVLTDPDGVCYRDEAGECSAYNLDVLDSEIRLGRLRIGNAHGSELLPLDLAWAIESWQAPGVFLPDSRDTCSAPTWGEAEASEQKGQLEGKSLNIAGGQIGSQGNLTVEEPEVTGSARIGFPNVPEWLWYDWRGEGREASRGLATFGIYQGSKPLIFRREVYR